jgi:hypothetical protein
MVVSSSPAVARLQQWGQDLMTTQRSGTMARRGVHARDTGSTTGVATAVLALLSAGTLASLGLVTADELRGGAGSSLRAPYNDLLPPVDVVVTPTPTPGPPSSGPRGSGGSGGSRPVPGPFEPAALTGGLDGSGPTLAASGPGEPVVVTPTGAPTPPVPSGPVFTALEPAPTPAPSVLAVKHGKAVGHAHAPGQANKAAKPPRQDEGTVAAAATPTSLTFLGLTPAVSGGGPGHHGHGRPAHRSSTAVTAPPLTAAAPAPADPADAPVDAGGPGNGHGHAYGHDKA